MGVTSPKVGIIGGTGRMGGWFAELLQHRGLSVLSAGRNTMIRPVEIARQCDVVVISVPIADTVRVIREIGPMMSEEALMMDLSSIKKSPVEAMLKYSRGEVVGLHPLFGPESMKEKDLRVAICPGRGEKGLKWITTLFEDESYKVTIIEADVHDQMMGFIQAVNHFSTLTFAMTVSDSGFKLKDLLDLSTNSFLERLDRIKVVLDQPAELFWSLLTENPAAKNYIKHYMESIESLKTVIGDVNRAAFDDLFTSQRKFFKAGIKNGES